MVAQKDQPLKNSFLQNSKAKQRSSSFNSRCIWRGGTDIGGLL